MASASNVNKNDMKDKTSEDKEDLLEVYQNKAKIDHILSNRKFNRMIAKYQSKYPEKAQKLNLTRSNFLSMKDDVKTYFAIANIGGFLFGGLTMTIFATKGGKQLTVFNGTMWGLDEGDTEAEGAFIATGPLSGQHLPYEYNVVVDAAGMVNINIPGHGYFIAPGEGEFDGVGGGMGSFTSV